MDVVTDRDSVADVDGAGGSDVRVEGEFAVDRGR